MNSYATYTYSGVPIYLYQNGSWTSTELSELQAGDVLVCYVIDGVIQIIWAEHEEDLGSESGMEGGGMSGGDASGSASAGGSASSGGSGTTTQTTPAYEEYVIEQQELLVITDQAQMQVSIQVDELDILSLQTDLEAQITLDAMKGQSFTGTVTQIGITGTNSGGNTKFTVTVTLPKDENMLEGMNASVKITTDTSDAAVAVSAAALVEDGGKTYVYTTYDEKKDELGGLVAVETGVSDGDLVEITSGLESGDTVYYRYAETVTYTFL